MGSAATTVMGMRSVLLFGWGGHCGSKGGCGRAISLPCQDAGSARDHCERKYPQCGEGPENVEAQEPTCPQRRGRYQEACEETNEGQEQAFTLDAPEQGGRRSPLHLPRCQS